MPVVVFANPKGGVGKSTTALVLGTTMAHMGISVSIVDADPRQVLSLWGKKTQTRSPHRVTIIGSASERTILPTIDERAQIDQVVLVDLEGTASRLTSYAISRADLVLVPMQATALDAQGAADVIGMIREEEMAFRRDIDARVFFTRTSPAIPSKIEKAILRDLAKTGIPMLRTHLYQRQAYNAVFAYSLPIPEINTHGHNVDGIDKAQENAVTLSEEVLAILEDQQSRKAVA